MKFTIGYRRWNTMFFAVCFVLFLIPCISLEISGEMTGMGRCFTGGMLLLLLYGLFRSCIRFEITDTAITRKWLLFPAKEIAHTEIEELSPEYLSEVLGTYKAVKSYTVHAENGKKFRIPAHDLHAANTRFLEVLFRGQLAK